MTQFDATGEKFTAFVRTIAQLRGPDGCPWDREQTHTSIARNMIEEAHEAVAAMETDDIGNMREELGDVLLQVVLQSQIAADAGEFTLDDVIDEVQEKMIRRHPHVFGNEAAFRAARFTPEQIAHIESAQTAGKVLDLWDQIKLHEREQKEQRRLRHAWEHQGDCPPQPPGLLDDVPRSLPALMQAYDISRKAVAVGFEWETVEDIWRQVTEEVDEFKESEPGSEHAVEEFGDVLFALVNVARKQGIDAESALRVSCGKFRNRWAIMERHARDEGVRMDQLGLERLEELWQEAKVELASFD